MSEFVIPAGKVPSRRGRQVSKSALPKEIKVSGEEISNGVKTIDWSETQGMGGVSSWSKTNSRTLDTYTVDPNLINLPEEFKAKILSAEVSMNVSTKIVVAY